MSYLYVEVRPGEGGDDAYTFAEELIASPHRFATRSGWPGERLPGNRTLVLRLSPSGSQMQKARHQLSSFTGTHRIQRVPSSDSGRRHTSTASVAVLDQMEQSSISVREQDLRVDRMRGSGTGGQRRNKVETAIRLTHLPSGIVITRTSGRSQAANLQDAKTQPIEQLNARASEQIVVAQHGRRRAQTLETEAAKGFTHCIYRDEVIRHEDNKRWTVRSWRQGRLS